MKKFVVALSTGIEVVDTVKEVVALLDKDGVSVRQKEVLAGNVEQVQRVEEEEIAGILAAAGQEVPDAKPADTMVEESKPADDQSEDTSEDTQDDTNSEDKPSGNDKPADDDNAPEYPEVGHFKDEKAFKKYIKAMKNNEHVFEWCSLEGVEWKRCPEQPPIDRMRAIMALKAKHFPHTAPKASTKSKSAYAQYETEDLVQMALDNDIYVTGDNGDTRILRMKTIMALRAAGIIV